MALRRLGRATAVVVVLTLLAVQFALPASAAGTSAVPADVRFVSSWTDPVTGMRWDRYQQYAAPLNVFVDDGQMILIVSGSRVVQTAGEHYPGLRVSTLPALSPTQAVAVAAAVPATNSSDASGTGQPSVAMKRSAQLRVDPDSGRLFYRVTSAAPGNVIYQDIDANTGAVLQTWSGIETDAPSGTGVKADTKSLAGDALTGAGNGLTSPAAGGWKMVSVGDRYDVADANGSSSMASYPTAPMTDGDDGWTGARQIAAVDAQYYAALTDNFYKTEFGFDLPACLGGTIHSVVHFGHSYANAFWDSVGQVMVYGDGDGTTYSQMSGAQDVVSHELSHAVTSCHANLDYIKESGALNEAFSDIMGTTAEFEMLEPNSSNCVREAGQATCADWWLAEDLIIGGSQHAIRSLADPEILGQPSHYSQRVFANTNPLNCNNFNDYCGVHANSGIANHAFYLLAHGGRNARCSGPTDPQADCDVLVPGIGVDHASNIFLRAWFEMTTKSNFCNARSNSIEQAQSLVDTPSSGYTQADVAAAELAWDAVGVYCPAPLSYSLNVQSRSAVAKPGGTVDATISITRTPAAAVTFSVSDSSPATASFAPNGISGGSAVLHFGVPGGATAGVYPMVVTATDGTTTQKVALALVVDNDLPTAVVSSVSMTAGDTVASNGHAPLHISWSTSDATSGVASGCLSIDARLVASGVSGPTTFASANGTHVFQASATDQAGNSGTSAPLSVTQTSAQETAATLTKTWTKSTVGTPWGTTMFSKKKGATATFKFSGTDVAWVSARGPKRGKAKVYIDGTLEAVVDLKTSTSASSVIVYVASGLSAGPHTIKVYVNGTSGRPRVDVDGFVVLSP